MTTHERILEALISHLVRSGALDSGDIDEMAKAIEPHDADASHLLRCLMIEANAPAEREWRAGQVRRRFRVIEGDPSAD